MKKIFTLLFALTSLLSMNAQEEVSYTFTNLEMDDTYGGAGIYQLSAGKDSVEMVLLIMGATVPGEYNDSVASFQLKFTHPDESYTIVSSDSILNASVSIAEDQTPIMKARFMGSDQKVYNIDACFQKPAITDSLDINIDGLSIIDNIDDFGAYFFYGYSKDTTNYVLIYCDAEQIPGHYTMKDLQAHRAHNYLVFIQDEAAGIYTKEYIYDADFDVTVDGRKVNLAGDFQIGTHFIHMTLEGTIPITGIDNDNNYEDVDVAFAKDELTQIRKDDGSQKAVYVRLQNAERGDIFSMYMYVDHYDDDITIPEGTYEVISTYKSGTVQQGDYINNCIFPSFYGYSEDGDQIMNPLWYLRSGTVTVTNRNGELSFEVNGQNSYERTVHVTYNIDETAVNSIFTGTKASTRKIIEDNKIVIVRDGDKYSVAGQKLK